MSKTLSTASLTVSFSLLPVSSVSALAASSAFFVSAAAAWRKETLVISKCVPSWCVTAQPISPEALQQRYGAA